MTGNVDGLLSVSVAEGDKGVDFPPVLVFKEVRQVLKLFHGLVADRADRPVLFRNVHSLRRSRFFWPLVFLRAGVTCGDAMPLCGSFQGNSSWKILDGVGLVRVVFHWFNRLRCYLVGATLWCGVFLLLVDNERTPWESID